MCQSLSPDCPSLETLKRGKRLASTLRIQAIYHRFAVKHIHAPPAPLPPNVPIIGTVKDELVGQVMGEDWQEARADWVRLADEGGILEASSPHDEIHGESSALIYL